MCKGNDHFHEDFGDEPSIEERIPEGWGEIETSVPFDDDFEPFPFINDADDEDEDFEDEDYDEELARDSILERQELEDFEGFNPFESDVGGESGW